jgi:hypothetical protein
LTTSVDGGGLVLLQGERGSRGSVDGGGFVLLLRERTCRWRVD